MDRGGYYSETYGHARVVRSASRVDRRLSNVNPGIGFPEWCSAKRWGS